MVESDPMFNAARQMVEHAFTAGFWAMAAGLAWLFVWYYVIPTIARR